MIKIAPAIVALVIPTTEDVVEQPNTAYARTIDPKILPPITLTSVLTSATAPF